MPDDKASAKEVLSECEEDDITSETLLARTVTPREHY
jgi:hypothetical protein